jgi:hypothetical protein
MQPLLFKNPVFNSGRNVTVRRGTKWDLGYHEGINLAATDDPKNILQSVEIETQCYRFCDIPDRALKYEHDPACRSKEGLLKVMQEVYSRFHEDEIVTLVWFTVSTA